MNNQVIITKVSSNRLSQILLWLFIAGVFAVMSAGKVVAQSQPQPANTQNIWQFWSDYRGADKVRRLLNSYAVGIIGGGCTGTMISPHIMLSAAHCGGPSWEQKTVQFFHMDEDGAGPAPGYQRKSSVYYARSFPWQEFTNNDFMLWWVEDGSDGVPPGIKYGYRELNTGVVAVGNQAYSFWWNRYNWTDPDDPNNTSSFDTLYHSVGEATSLGDVMNSDGPLHFTNYNVSAVQGASGSSVIDAGAHSIIGVTAIARNDWQNNNWRRAADTSYVLELHDGDRNKVLDVVEYDLLITESSREFRLLTFNTPLQRAQWLPGYNAQVTLARPVLQGVPVGGQPANWVGHVGGSRSGPIWYRACWNGPWRNRFIDGGNPNCVPDAGYFLEDFEDGLLDTPGVQASTGSVRGPGSSTDSVDNDDGSLDHNGNNGYSLLSSNGRGGITFTFSQSTLGSLPKRAGIVWTDGDGKTAFEAFDAQGGLLGQIGPIQVADDSHQGTDIDDRFFGFIHQAGISKVRIWNTEGGIEVDHLQYDINDLSSGGDCLGHKNARFDANATYRITAVVYGLSQNNRNGKIAFIDSGSRNAPRQEMNFETSYAGWSRVSGRVTLGNSDEYRLVLGAPAGSSFYVSSIAILRESEDAVLTFQTDEERASWEYINGGHPTTWGINGPGDFSGVVIGPSPGWSLRQRNLALEANQMYNITFDVKHVSGDMANTYYMRVENLSAIEAGEKTWQFTQNEQIQTLMLPVNTGDESGNALVFGSNAAGTYLVDNIRIQRVYGITSIIDRPSGKDDDKVREKDNDKDNKKIRRKKDKGSANRLK